MLTVQAKNIPTGAIWKFLRPVRCKKVNTFELPSNFWTGGQKQVIQSQGATNQGRKSVDETANRI